MTTETTEIETIREQVEKRKQADAKLIEAELQTEEEEIDSTFVRQCLDANFLGDGVLFNKIFRNKYVFNKSAGWMVWCGHHWDIDIMDEAEGSVERLAEIYLDEMAKINTEIKELDEDDNKRDQLKRVSKKLYMRVQRMRDPNQRSKVIKMTHVCPNPIAIRGDELDKKPWKLPCANGVLDLRTGVLEKGNPADYLVRAAPTEWHGIDAPCPTWERALMEILSDRPVLYEFMQRLLGYAIVGESIEHIIAVWTGQGRNGKSLIINTITYVLGHLAGAIRSEMLLDQNRQSGAAGPTPEIMTLRGLRVAIASETDENCKVSPSRVKWLTGNDELAGRDLYGKYEIRFQPTHTLFLLTNHKPHAPADDFAFWERVCLIPFDLSFVNRKPREPNERRADPYLAEKLKAEAPGILAWLVKGCLMWQKEGLNPPAIVKDAVAEYRKNEDILAEFIEECCFVDEKVWVGATQLYAAFEIWWQRNVSKNVPKQKRFGMWMGQKYKKEKNGNYRYMGVGLLSNLDDHGSGLI